MDQTYFRKIGLGIALLTLWQILGCGSSTKTTPTPPTTPVTTPPPAAPQITQFSATPTAVNAGQTTTITWATTNAASITISPAVPQSEDTGPLPTSGSS